MKEIIRLLFCGLFVVGGGCGGQNATVDSSGESGPAPSVGSGGERIPVEIPIPEAFPNPAGGVDLFHPPSSEGGGATSGEGAPTFVLPTGALSGDTSVSLPDPAPTILYRDPTAPVDSGEGAGPTEIPLESLYATEVISYSPGENAGYGQDQFPNIVLGPPQGGGLGQASLDVLSLGDQGEIVLGFGDQVIVDKEGADFTIFENPFTISGTTGIFVEVGIVSVSQDGKVWCPFPFDIHLEISLSDPLRYEGFAGVHPVFSSIQEDGTVAPDPFDPSVSGGDSFDLAQIGFPWARFIRITDPGFQATADSDGDWIEDPGDHVMGPGQSGFDLDSIAALYASPWTFFLGTEFSACP